MPVNEKEIPYLQLDPEVEAAIRADRAAGRPSPHRFEDEAVVRRDDLPHDRATLTRPAFARDIEKILNIPAYNRYTDKTQVFSFVQNDDICRRGLHVQLVSRIARGIGALLGLNEQLIEAIALGRGCRLSTKGPTEGEVLDELYEQNRRDVGGPAAPGDDRDGDGRKAASKPKKQAPKSKRGPFSGRRRKKKR